MKAIFVIHFYQFKMLSRFNKIFIKLIACFIYILNGYIPVISISVRKNPKPKGNLIGYQNNNDVFGNEIE